MLIDVHFPHILERILALTRFVRAPLKDLTFSILEYCVCRREYGLSGFLCSIFMFESKFWMAGNNYVYTSGVYFCLFLSLMRI